MTSSSRRHARAVSVQLARFATLASLAAGSVLVAGSSPAAAAAPVAYTDCATLTDNLITDCGLESGTTGGWSQFTGVGFVDVVPEGHSGEYALRYFQDLPLPEQGFARTVTVPAAGTYTFGVWTRSLSGRSSGFTVGAGGPQVELAPEMPRPDWTYVSADLELPAGASTLLISSTQNPGLQFDDFDDFSLRTAASAVTVSYDANAPADELDGDLPADGSFTSGGSPYLVAAADDLSRFGYDFTGWNTRANGSGDGYLPGSALTPAQDVTLYAQWRIATSVDLQTSSLTQVYRTTDPQTLHASTHVGPEDVGVGIIRFRHGNDVIGTVRIDEFGEAAMRVPTDLPLGRTSFTAEFTPTSRELQPAVSEPAPLTIARVGTTTRVQVRQQTLSKSEQQKFTVRSSLSVSVQVVGNGTRTLAAGAVAINVNGKVTTLRLVNGRAKTALVPTAAGAKKVFATYQPSTDFWVRSTGRAEITVR